ncbi:hypothetical protein ACIQTW_20315 [Paenarthrobacter sp. NPDC090517]|uniref:hypothetical protein n=1 Tax=Paenarthrobacter sp. NPDC090517 TaxID=3364381 RepID=UPI0037F5FB39
MTGEQPYTSTMVKQTVQMKLSESNGDLKSPNEAYNEVTDQLRMEDSEANSYL